MHPRYIRVKLIDKVPNVLLFATFKHKAEHFQYYELRRVYLPQIIIFTFDRYDTVAKSAFYAATVDINMDTKIECEYQETKNTHAGTYASSGSK